MFRENEYFSQIFDILRRLAEAGAENKSLISAARPLPLQNQVFRHEERMKIEWKAGFSFGPRLCFAGSRVPPAIGVENCAKCGSHHFPLIALPRSL
jgi:hypothetical protein